MNYDYSSHPPDPQKPSESAWAKSRGSGSGYAALAVLLVYCMFISSSPAGAAENASLRGIATDSITGTALAGIEINLAGTGFRTKTNEKGEYSIDGIPPGEYDVLAVRAFYRRAKVR